MNNKKVMLIMKIIQFNSSYKIVLCSKINFPSMVALKAKTVLMIEKAVNMVFNFNLHGTVEQSAIAQILMSVLLSLQGFPPLDGTGLSQSRERV